MTHTMSHHEQTYARLVAEYVASLPEKVAVLERAMVDARTSAPALAQAREVAHRMRGTAGCYGFRELSDAAGLLDEILTALQRGEGGSWEEAESSTALVRVVADAATKQKADKAETL
jgi:HPt (histidine-containing phosphotransfer) domain-containing protein